MLPVVVAVVVVAVELLPLASVEMDTSCVGIYASTDLAHGVLLLPVVWSIQCGDKMGRAALYRTDFSF
jgi:hypothetical protein